MPQPKKIKTNKTGVPEVTSPEALIINDADKHQLPESVAVGQTKFNRGLLFGIVGAIFLVLGALFFWSRSLGNMLNLANVANREPTQTADLSEFTIDDLDAEFDNLNTDSFSDEYLPDLDTTQESSDDLDALTNVSDIELDLNGTLEFSDSDLDGLDK